MGCHDFDKLPSAHPVNWYYAVHGNRVIISSRQYCITIGRAVNDFVPRPRCVCYAQHVPGHTVAHDGIDLNIFRFNDSSGFRVQFSTVVRDRF